MTEVGPTSQRPPTDRDAAGTDADGAPATSPSMERVGKLTAVNMVRSLAPLVLICLALVGWNALRQDPGDPVREVDPGSTVQLAAARADYPLLAPAGLSDDFRPTSARTDAGNAAEGDPVTLEIGYLTPSEEYAGFVVSDDPEAAPLVAVLADATEEGAVDVAGQTWTRSTTGDGETALSRELDGDVTVVVTGSAPDDELETVAAAVRPYSG